MNTTRAGTKLILTWLFVYEIAFLLIIELYKYWLNSEYDSLISHDLLAYTIRNFNLFYTGNLFWITLFITSVIALINIILHLNKVSSGSLKSLAFLSVAASVVLLIVISSGKPPRESFLDNLVNLSSKGVITIMLTLVAAVHLVITVSLCVISFTVLMRLYIFRTLFITMMIILTGYLIVFIACYYYKDDYELLVKNKITADAGTVLGAAVWGGNRPSPVLRERINKGYELYSKGIIRYIILTGGGSPGEMTEAEVSKKELLKKGVKNENILIENKSNSTLEQISYLSKYVYNQNNWDVIVIISDNFHLLRTKQICLFFNIKAFTVSSDTPLSAESTFNFCIKESFAVILFWLFGIG